MMMSAMLLSPPMAGDSFWTDTNTWVLVAFIIFIGIIVYSGALGMIGSMLDQRSVRIRDQLNEARSLREEAQRKHADAERRQRDAEAQAEEIVTRSKKEAEDALVRAKSEIAAQVERRVKTASERIARAEADAVRAVRNAAVDAGVEAVRAVMTQEMTEDARQQLTDRAIAEASGRLAETGRVQ